MDGFVKVEPLEEFEHLPEIKTEPFDNTSEQYDDISEKLFDEIEIGEEFKSKSIIHGLTANYFSNVKNETLQCFDEVKIKKEIKCEPLSCENFSDARTNLIDKANILVWCIKCNKTRKYVARKGNSCHKCKTILMYKCGRCKKQYKLIKSLHDHISRYCNNKKSKLCCDHCQYETKLKGDLSRHIQAKHLPRDPNLNRCSKCAKSFSRRSNLSTHLKLCGQKKDFKRSLVRFSCDHCNYKSIEKPKLSQHIQAKHLPRDINSNKCSKCGKNFSNRSHLTKHLKICGQSKDFKRSLMRFYCDHCEYKSDTKFHLSIHIQAKHLPRDLTSNKCSKCGKSFLYQSSLSRHLKICGKIEESRRLLMRFSCDHCNFKSSLKSNISRHIQAKHLPRDHDMNKCGKCGKTFLRRSNLQRHSKICFQAKDSKHMPFE